MNAQSLSLALSMSVLRRVVALLALTPPLDPGGGVLLGIFDGGVPPATPNPDPILDHFPYPFSDLASKIHTHFQT